MAAVDLTTEEWDRYARQIGPGVLTREGQRRLKEATVLISRTGGMGGPAAMALVMAGVGRVIIAHGGTLISPDLNRQSLGTEEILGQVRAHAFADRLRSLNRFVTVEAVDHEPNEEEAHELAGRADLILSCAPSFAERLRLNRAAVRRGIPLVDAAQWGIAGTLIVVEPRRTACLQCVYPNPPLFEEHFPVLGAISTALGGLAALEAIKILSGTGTPLTGQLWTIDAYQGRSTTIQLARDPQCACCGPAATGHLGNS